MDAPERLHCVQCPHFPTVLYFQSIQFCQPAKILAAKRKSGRSKISAVEFSADLNNGRKGSELFEVCF
jgi:hypothetical protein